VFGRTIVPYKGETPWVPGLRVGVSIKNNNHMILAKEGFVECYSVRRRTRPMALEEVKKLQGLPWDRQGTIVKCKKKKNVRVPLAVADMQGPMAGGAEALLGAAAAAAAVAPRPEAPAAPAGEDGDPNDQDHEEIQEDMGEAASDPPSGSSEELAPDSPVTVTVSSQGSGRKRPAEQGESQPRRAAPSEMSEAARGSGQPKREAPVTAEELRDETTPQEQESHAVRRVETVDAAWFEPQGFEEGAEDFEDIENIEDIEDIEHEGAQTTAGGGRAQPEGHDKFEGKEPPELDAETLQNLDDEAECAETDRLVEMGVLAEPVDGELAEFLSTTFVVGWKFREDKWFRRARLVARQYKYGSSTEEADTYSPASIGPLLRHVLLAAQEWNTPVYVLDVKDACLNVEQPADEPVVIQSPKSYERLWGTTMRWKLGRVLPGQRRGAQEWYMQLNGTCWTAAWSRSRRPR
jgi:hypothetical protein